MLAALAADRFLLFKEAELIALNIPYDLRRSTLDRVLKFRKEERPFNPKHMPKMTPAADYYLDRVSLAQRESRYAYNQLQKLRPAYLLAQKVQAQPRSMFDPPLNDRGVFDQWKFHIGRINDWHDTCHAAWDVLTWEEAQWFGHCPPVTRWAWDFPGLAPIPHRFYPLEETPERERQMHLLRWVIQDCGEQV